MIDDTMSAGGGGCVTTVLYEHRLAPTSRGKAHDALRSAALRADERSCYLAALAAGIVGASLITLWAASHGDAGERILLRGLTFLAGVLALAPRPPWGEVLRSASIVAMTAIGSGFAALLLILGARLAVWPGVAPGALLTVWAAAVTTAALTITLVRAVRDACPPLRLAVVGSGGSAAALATNLARQRPRRYEVVGYVGPACEPTNNDDVGMQLLGAIAEMPELIALHELELLILTPEISRLDFYDQVVSNCLISGVRIAELDQFYERAFGHVPVASIDSCWFYHLVTMDRARELLGLRRAVDLGSVAVLGTLALPLLALLTFLIRRDGGPALFRQRRIGEGGRPFVILKLRTMRVQDDAEARWTADRDPRITRIGRILRATHFDELPQLVNVLRGEMHIVGPRPEQPALVDRLEAVVPHYQRRHLVKPGVAGWAQARCGYAGSDDGSLRKVCHDLYYLRHRSIRFDVAILAETFFAMLRPDAAAATVTRQAERFRWLGRHHLERTDPLPEAGAPEA